MEQEDDLQAFLRQAQEITAQMQAVGEHASQQEITGMSEEGGVQITMTPGGEVHAVSIQPRVVNLDNLHRLEELIADAVRDALAKMQSAAAESLAPFAESFQRLGGSDSSTDGR
jgi:DNA-binding YbaB/EbfC family protein